MNLLLPTIQPGISELVDGAFIDVPTFCKKSMAPGKSLESSRKKCMKFHEECISQDGLHICPYGFSCYIHTSNGNKIIYVGLIIKGHSDYNKLSPKLDIKKCTQLTENELDKIIKHSDKSLEIEALSSASLRFLTTSLHNIKKLCSHIEYFADKLRNSIKDGNLKKTALQAYTSIALVNVNFEFFDSLVNVSNLQKGKKNKMQLWNKFYSMEQTLEVEANKKNLTFLNPDQQVPAIWIYAYDSLALLPYILYENAIKYSPEGSNIVTNYIEQEDILKLTISNMGYKYSRSQINQMFNKFYRADISNKEYGSGVGLFLAKNLCEIHNLDINIFSSDEDIQEIDGEIRSTFSVEIIIDKKFIK